MLRALGVAAVGGGGKKESSQEMTESRNAKKGRERRALRCESADRSPFATPQMPTCSGAAFWDSHRPIPPRRPPVATVDFRASDVVVAASEASWLLGRKINASVRSSLE